MLGNSTIPCTRQRNAHRISASVSAYRSYQNGTWQLLARYDLRLIYLSSLKYSSNMYYPSVIDIILLRRSSLRLLHSLPHRPTPASVQVVLQYSTIIIGKELLLSIYMFVYKWQPLPYWTQYNYLDVPTKRTCIRNTVPKYLRSYLLPHATIDVDGICISKLLFHAVVLTRIRHR